MEDSELLNALWVILCDDSVPEREALYAARFMLWMRRDEARPHVSGGGPVV